MELSGEQDTGKTSTLLTLINKLYKAAHRSERVQLFMIDEEGKKIHMDQDVVIEYRGVKIAICTGGDKTKKLIENINFFNSHDWDIAISATRSQGSRSISAFAADNHTQPYKVLKGWVSNISLDSLQEKVCNLLIEATAQAMMIIIDGWIEEMLKEK